MGNEMEGLQTCQHRGLVDSWHTFFDAVSLNGSNGGIGANIDRRS